jgi:microsomal dipeptidase-like Zn-dependent dipeptidase
MTRRRMYIIVALISHCKKKTMKRNARIAATLSKANATIDHFLNAGGSPFIPAGTGSDWDGQDKKIFVLLYYNGLVPE